MRHSRLLAPSDCEFSYYHCISRVVNRGWLLEITEKEYLRRWIHDLAFFSGIRVLSYCVLSNHFHLLLEIPRRPPSDQLPNDQELIRRIEKAWGHRRAKEVQWTLQQHLLGGRFTAANELRQSWFARMWNLSSYLKDLKQRFTQWFNHRKKHTGTLWECRFHSVLIENDGHALRTVACYIELNPVRAGLVDDPKDYRWCSYSDAINNLESSRESVSRLLMISPSHPKLQPHRTLPHPREMLRIWRCMILGIPFSRASRNSGAPAPTLRSLYGRRGIPLHIVREACHHSGILPWRDILGARQPALSRALWIGSLEFALQAITRSPAREPALSG